MASGSVYFRPAKDPGPGADGKARRKGKGSWAYTVDRPAGADGKRKQLTKSGFRTRKEADSARTAILNELRTGTYREPSTETLDQFLVRWLRIRKDTVRLVTHEDYARSVRLYISPLLGPLPLHKLAAIQVEEFLAACTDKDRLGLARGTTVKVFNILTGALNQAVKWKLIASNPCADARRPRATAEDRQKPKKYLTEDELATVLEALDGWLRCAAVIAAGTALRRGEVLGLDWKDIDWDARTLHIHQTVVCTEAKGTTIEPTTKTESSSATIAVEQALLDEFRRQKGQQAAIRLQFGGDYQDHGLIVCHPDGNPITPAVLSTRCTVLSAKLGIDFSFHTLRHTLATHLLKAKYPINAVSKHLRHASVTETLNTYAHVMAEMERDTAQGADDFLQRAIGPRQAAEGP